MHRYRTHTIPFAGVLLCLLAIAGCRSARPGPETESPRPLHLMLVGAPNLNSAGSEGGAAQSARVRIYELTGETNFRTVTLETFWRDDQAALGQELVGSQQVLLYPDTAQVVQLQPDPTTQFIGVAANLRLPDPQHWRQIYPVEAFRGRQVRIAVGADRVTVDLE